MLKKQYLKSKPVCKVTFEVPKDAGGSSGFLVGEFNGWDESATPLTALKDGRLKVVVELEPSREYQYRYIVDGNWRNDEAADKYVPNEFGEENSVVVT